MPAKRKSKVPLFRKAMAAVDAAVRDGVKPPGWARSTTIQVHVPSRPGVLLDLSADRVTHLPLPVPGQPKTLSLCPTCDGAFGPDTPAPPPCPLGSACPQVHAFIHGAHEFAPHARAVAVAMQQKAPLGARGNNEAPSTAGGAPDSSGGDDDGGVEEDARALSPSALRELAWLYERYPCGSVAVPVALAGTDMATEMVPPDHMLRTRALESDRRPVSHCAHFAGDKGRCDRGPECRFVHAVPLFLTSLRLPDRAAAAAAVSPISATGGGGQLHAANAAPLGGHISPLARAMSDGGAAAASPRPTATAAIGSTISPTSFLYGRGFDGIAGALPAVAPAAGGGGGGGGGVFDAVSHSADSVEVFVDGDGDPDHTIQHHRDNAAATDEMNTSLGAASPAIGGGDVSPSSHRQAPQWKLPAAYAMHDAGVELPQLPDGLLDAITPPESASPSAYSSPRPRALGQAQRAPPGFRQLSTVSSGAVSPLSSSGGSAVRCHRPYEAAPVRVEGVVTPVSPVSVLRRNVSPGSP